MYVPSDVLNSWELDSLIRLLMYHATPEMRQKIMQNLPQVYNKLHDREFVQVVRVSDQTPVTPKEDLIGPIRMKENSQEKSLEMEVSLSITEIKVIEDITIDILQHAYKRTLVHPAIRNVNVEDETTQTGEKKRIYYFTFNGDRYSIASILGTDKIEKHRFDDAKCRWVFMP